MSMHRTLAHVPYSAGRGIRCDFAGKKGYMKGIGLILLFIGVGAMAYAFNASAAVNSAIARILANQKLKKKTKNHQDP